MPSIELLLPAGEDCGAGGATRAVEILLEVVKPSISLNLYIITT